MQLTLFRRSVAETPRVSVFQAPFSSPHEIWAVEKVSVPPNLQAEPGRYPQPVQQQEDPGCGAGTPPLLSRNHYCLASSDSGSENGESWSSSSSSCLSKASILSCLRRRMRARSLLKRRNTRKKPADDIKAAIRGYPRLAEAQAADAESILRSRRDAQLGPRNDEAQ